MPSGGPAWWQVVSVPKFPIEKIIKLLKLLSLDNEPKERIDIRALRKINGDRRKRRKCVPKELFL